MRTLRLSPWLPTVLLLAAVPSRAGDERAAPATAAERLFAREIAPLLTGRCRPCHGSPDGETKGGLDLSGREAALRGGDFSDRVLVPGSAGDSLLYRAVAGLEEELVMPPKATDRLSEAEIDHLRRWIDAGAPWPGAERAEAVRAAAKGPAGVRWATSGGLTRAWDERRYDPEDLWAYRPLSDPSPPRAPEGVEKAATPIDAFVERRLREMGVQAPAPAADRRTLIRRLTFDLTGLPPKPADVEAFLADPDPDALAFQKVVDRLLASPHYGEQQARHWLDVVRYADSGGLSNDFERPNAWRYRDAVVRAFNEDLPYAEFVTRQIAGDELDPDDPENLVTVGFLRMGPWEHTAMSVGKVTRQRFLDDVTDSVGQVFLSHPLQCARCHDHKFSPVPTRDYYRIQAVFATTQFAGRPAPFLDEENTSGFEERRYLEERIDRYQEVLEEVRAERKRAERRWYAERGLESAPRKELRKRGVPEDEIAPRNAGLSPRARGLERIARKNIGRHRWELDRYRPIAFSVYSGATRSLRSVTGRLRMPEDPLAGGRVERTAILAGGDVFSPAESVDPGVLSAVRVPGLPGDIPAAPRGRRLAFARWLASSKNPLTWRSIANRVWQWRFGRGLVRTPNDFGVTGERPTHPQLLDWLAARLIEDGGSLERLARRILLSDAYRRASRVREPARWRELDPEGISYGRFRPRRLAAEEIRDAMLACSGELYPELGGVPVRPDIHPEVALQPRQIMGTYAPAYQASPRPEDRHRRTLYSVRIRGLSDPFLDVFDRPGTDTSCAARETSTTAPQALALLNNRRTRARALAMAVRLERETATREAAVRRAFRLAYGRSPRPVEVAEALAHVESMEARHRAISPAPERRAERVVRRAKEEMTGEPFEFTEELERVKDRVPGVRPGDLAPGTRALADLCRVLFNSNEFVFID